MYTFVSVNDELQELKQVAAELGMKIIKIEKVGNGNMSAFKMIYTENGSDEVKDNFFWRHDLDNFIEKLKKSASNK